MKVPRTIATCPTCGGTLCLDVEEWESATRRPTEAGCIVSCTRSEHDGALETREPYIYWLPIRVRVAAWAQRHVRVRRGGQPYLIARFTRQESA